MILKVRKPNVKIPIEWPGILEEFAKIKSEIKVRTVLWEITDNGWVKYNTDRAFRGEEGGSSYAFY